MQQQMGTIRRDGERRAVRFERRYDATIEDVWAALTEPDQLRDWLAATPVFEPRVGGKVVHEFEDGGVDGRVTAFEPPRLLEYEWRWTGEDVSILRWELEEDGDGTRIVLDHRLLEAVHAASYGAGWHSHLDRLEALVEGGDGDGDWNARYEALLPAYTELTPAVG